MFNLKQYIKKISWPIIALFLLSLIILAYLHNEYVELAVLLFILFSFSALLTFCKRKRLKKYLLAVEFAVIFLFLFLYPGFTVILLIAILHSFLYFYRAEKKYELQSILLTFTISLVFVYLILTANIIVLTYLLENMFSFILTMPLDAVIFVVFYILISTALLKKVGIYDFESYFRFKKLRFLNIFISKTKIRSTVKIALLVFFIFLIISIFPAYYLLFSVEELYKVVYENKEDISEDLVYELWKEESMPGFENNLKEKGYENISTPSLYSMEGFSKVNETAFYVNCTNQFECEKLPNAYHSPKINTTDFLQERYLQAHKNGEVYIFELPEFENYKEKKEEVINQKPNASFYPEIDTQGSRYINNIYGKRVVNLLNYSLPQPKISLYLNYNGIPLNESIEFLQKYIYYGSASEITESAEYIYPSEKKWLNKTYNTTKHYNNATSLKEHKAKLNESIKFLEKLYKPPSLDETEFTEQDCYMKDQIEDDSKFEQLLLRYSGGFFELQKQSCLLIVGIRSTEEGDKTLHQTIKYLNESIEKQSGSEKALDMKMLEHFLAKGAMSTGNCTTFECEKQILENTQNPHLCLETNEWYSEEGSFDGCYMKFAHYDKSICKEKFSESDKKQECLEKAEKKLDNLR